ncbi:uncharacterized protein LOC131159454 isoform X3 [Malania oleifera]|uniref:uncharacterized protein LOC131159454 isoform X3 n=1 Tax=Malania oleifera TaxID=397392 RepID=UPI0025ADEC8F|nr:uncharacterized protein LOC131159454 isoform X3 [Malania oleifera]
MATSLPPIEEPPAQTPLLTEKDTPLHLRQTLHRLETFLRIFGFCQYSVLSQALSWVAFLLLAVALPLLVIELSYCSHCERYQIKRFDLQILISEALVAAISLLSISHNLRKYGIRKFLFVDRDHGHMTQFREQYVQKIHDFFRLLALWVLPCFIVKTACEVVQVCSIVELVGIILCLHAAAKISHRAQGLASVASRWHASVTCNPNNASQLGPSSNEGNSDPTFPVGPLSMSYSESDLESIEFVPMPTNTQLASNMSSYHKRQAFVMYLQSNPRGATIFGWTVDRALINTIFFVELSLVLFVLGKTISFTTN